MDLQAQDSGEVTYTVGDDCGLIRRLDWAGVCSRLSHTVEGQIQFLGAVGWWYLLSPGCPVKVSLSSLPRGSLLRGAWSE